MCGYLEKQIYNRIKNGGSNALKLISDETFH